MSGDSDDPYEPGQRWGDLDWGLWRPTTAQRVAAGSFLIVFAAVEANYQFRWGLLRNYDGAACAVVGFLGAVMLLRMLPPVLHKRK